MGEMPTRWNHGGFAGFRQGEFDNGGDNLYVTRGGAIEWIHRTDVNGDGHVDLVFPNSHGYDERGPTWIYTQPPAPGHPPAPGAPPPPEAKWGRHELPNDSGWMSHAADLDGDGFLDLVVVDAENGVTSELDSYVYWGGSDGLTGARSELPTAGAYDVAAVDLTGNGLLDLIMPSAWVDHHNAGEPRPLHVYLQTAPRVFADATAEFAIPGVGALAVACEDIDGELELVVANYRAGFEHHTDSFLYRRRGTGFAVDAPLRLPTRYAMQVALADLDGDGMKEVIFSGGHQVRIFWNRAGRIAPEVRTVLPVEGTWTMFAEGAARIATADVDGDGRDELLVAAQRGVEIRSADALDRVRQLLPLTFCSWVHAADLDGDGRVDLVVSRARGWPLLRHRVGDLLKRPGGVLGTAGRAAADRRRHGLHRRRPGRRRTVRRWCSTTPWPAPRRTIPSSRCTSTWAGRADASTRRGAWSCPPTADNTYGRRRPRPGRPCRPGVHHPRRPARVPRRSGRPVCGPLHRPARPPAGTCTTCRWATSTATAGSTCWRWPTPTMTSPPPWPPRR